jgi:hypothetical protein
MSAMDLTGAVRTTGPRRLTPILVGVWAAAIAGVALGVSALTTSDSATVPERAASAAPATPPAAGPAGLGDRVRMSFGVASVGSVVKVTGPAYAMGMRVEPGEQVFQAQVTVVNVQRRPVVYDPDLMRLTPRGRVGAVVVATGSAEGGRIEALAAHRFAIRFALASGAPLPQLRLGDPAGGRPTRVSLGSTSGIGTLDLGEHHPAVQPSTGGRGR